MFKIIVSIIFITVPATIFALMGLTVEMGLILFAGITVAVLLNMDRFENFKISTTSLEAKLKKAEKEIDEASVTIKQLRSFIEPLLNANINYLIYDGFLDGMDLKAKERVLKDLYSMQQSKGIKIESDLYKKAADNIAAHYLICMIRETNNSQVFEEQLKVVEPEHGDYLVEPLEIDKIIKAKGISVNNEFHKYYEGYKVFYEEVSKGLLEIF